MMASGSQNLTTYTAKRIIGDSTNVNWSGALLHSGTGGKTNAMDTWIFADDYGSTSSTYGILHRQSDDKIVFVGASTDRFWNNLNTGDTYVAGKLGINYNPETTGNTYQLYINGSTASGNLFPLSTRESNLGSSVLMWNDAHIRGIATRHIDAADQAYITDGQLHIGYGSVAPTTAIYLYYSADTSSRTKFFEVNSNGAYALTRFGVNGQNTSDTLYVNGTTCMTDNLTRKCLNVDASKTDNNISSIIYPTTFNLTDNANRIMTRLEGVIQPNGAIRSYWYVRNYDVSGTQVAQKGIYMEVANDGTMTYSISDAPKFRTAISTWALVSSSYNTFMPPDGTTNTWYKFGTADGYGILPALSGGAENGHSYIGTSSWYWKYLYVDRAYTGKITIQQPAAHRDNGIVGEYNYQKAGAIWSMGASYQIKADGSGLGTLYGAAYGYGGQAYLGSNTYAGGHQFLWCENGQVMAALGQGIWTSGAVNIISRGSNRAYVSIRSATAVPMDLYLGSNNTNYWSISVRESTNPWLGFYWAGSSSGWALNMLTNRHVEIPVHAYIGGYNNTSYALSTASFICQSWIRTTGSTGWYNESYGGGWYMQDSTYIRNYGSKHLYITGRLGVDCELRLWGNTRQITRASRSVGWISGRDSALIREDNADGYHGVVMTKTVNGAWTIGNYNSSGWYNYLLFSYTSDSNYNAGNNTATTIRMRDSGVVESAMWNDYAEYRKANTIEPGRVVVETGNDDLQLCNQRLAAGGRVISDTYGFAIGQTKDCQTPIAVSGRVLVYPYKNRNKFKPGDAVCTAPNGTVDVMTRKEIILYPERIIGTVSAIPTYETWYGGGNYDEDGDLIPIPVNGRIWIYVR